MNKKSSIITELVLHKEAPYYGLSIILVPFYLYTVDVYYDKFNNWIIDIMLNYSWGTYGLLAFMVGFFIIYTHYDLKDERDLNENRYLYLTTVLTLSLLIASWTVHKSFAYMNAIFFIFVMSRLLLILMMSLQFLLESYQKLNDIEKITLLIPVITVLLNKIL